MIYNVEWLLDNTQTDQYFKLDISRKNVKYILIRRHPSWLKSKPIEMIIKYSDKLFRKRYWYTIAQAMLVIHSLLGATSIKSMLPKLKKSEQLYDVWIHIGDNRVIYSPTRRLAVCDDGKIHSIGLGGMSGVVEVNIADISGQLADSTERDEPSNYSYRGMHSSETLSKVFHIDISEKRY